MKVKPLEPCPKCKSFKVEKLTIPDGQTINVVVCLSCGYWLYGTIDIEMKDLERAWNEIKRGQNK